MKLMKWNGEENGMVEIAVSASVLSKLTHF